MHAKSLRTTVLQIKETRHHWLSRLDRNSQSKTVLEIEGTRLGRALDCWGQPIPSPWNLSVW